MGFANSEAFPKTAQEYVGIRAGMLEDKKKHLERRIANDEADQRNRLTQKPLWSSEIKEQMELLRNLKDGRSKVLAQPTCFNEPPPDKPDNEQGDWPTAAELKQCGEEMARLGLPRSLPRPRINRPDPARFPGISRTHFENGTVPHEKREVTDGRWDWAPWRERERLRRAQVDQEPKIEELSGPMQDLIKHIRGEDDSDTETITGEGDKPRNPPAN